MGDDLLSSTSSTDVVSKDCVTFNSVATFVCLVGVASVTLLHL